jgi:hypothetical protein
MSACDTVAELTFQDEQLIEMSPVGLVAADCLPDADADAVLRFSVLTSFDEVMVPGKRYVALGDSLVAGQNFGAKDIVLSDGWFFVVDTAGRDMECSDAATCPTGASCLSPTEMGLDQYYYAPEKFCVYATTIQAGTDPVFYHYRDRLSGDEAHVTSSLAGGRSFAFVIDNSASLDGSSASGVPDAAKATDPYQYRKVGLNQFMDGLAVGESVSTGLEFAALFANGIGTNGVFDVSKSWMRSIAVWMATVMQKYPTPSGGSPIWESASAALDKMMNTANAGYTHTIVSLTDGAPDSADEVYKNFSRQLMASDISAIYWLDFEAEDAVPHTPYADIVAQSCGAYYLFSNAAQFPALMRNIAINSASHWDVGLKFSAKLPAGYLYRLATQIVVRVGSSAVSYEAQRKSEQQAAMDYRLVISR